jgi:hypothetical protein
MILRNKIIINQNKEVLNNKSTWPLRLSAQNVDKLNENWVCLHFFLVQIRTWFPLQALAFRGRSGSLLGMACGVSLGHAFPAGVSHLTFQSTGTFFKIKTAGWSIPNQVYFILWIFLLYSLLDGRNLRHSCRITG